MLCSLHTHSLFCDGHSTLEEMALAACEQGLDVLGFSGHAPAPYDGAAMAAEDADKYLAEIARLKGLFSGRIELYAGIENDALCPFDRARLDYCIGSVHYIRDDAGIIHCIDNGHDRFAGAVSALGGIQPLIERYCETFEEHLLSYRPDIAGHADIIAKLNDGRYFDASEPWYRSCERHLAETIIRSGCIAEVNCAGLRIPHREAVYPSENILTMLYESGVPVMLTADAHRPEHLVAGYDKARELLRKIGFTSTVVLHGGRFVEQEL